MGKNESDRSWLVRALLAPLRWMGCGVSRQAGPKGPPIGTAIDYTKVEHWIHCGVTKPSDFVPEGATPAVRPDAATCDVFYVHPTMVVDPLGTMGRKNMHLNEEGILGAINYDDIAKGQAAVFNGSCAVYMPKYRAVTLNTYKLGDDGRAA